ncbi:MAG: glycosyltransferase [bacterium]
MQIRAGSTPAFGTTIFMISLALLTCNHYPELKRILNLLLSHCESEGIEDVFVVDNDSDDGSIEYLRCYYKTLRIRCLTERQHISAHMNEAVSLAEHERVILVTPECLDIQLNVRSLNTVMDDPEVFGVAFSEFYKDRPRMSVLRPRFYLGFVLFEPYHCEQDLAEVPCFGQYGFCVNRDLFLVMGGAKNLFSSAFVRIDLCYRAYKRGYKVLFSKDQRLCFLEAKNPPLLFPSPDHFRFFWVHVRSIWRCIVHVFILFFTLLFFLFAYQRAFFVALFRLAGVWRYRRAYLQLCSDSVLLRRWR